MDTSAILQNLDLMITSDSAIAHLAGALGVKTWLILPIRARLAVELGTSTCELVPVDATLPSNEVWIMDRSFPEKYKANSRNSSRIPNPSAPQRGN